MNDISIMIQTRIGDTGNLDMLMKSINEYNTDTIPIFMAVHNGEQTIFANKYPQVKTVYENDRIFESKLTDDRLRTQSLRFHLHKLNIANEWIILESTDELSESFTKHNNNFSRVWASNVLDWLEHSLLDSSNMNSDHLIALLETTKNIVFDDVVLYNTAKMLYNRIPADLVIHELLK